MLVDDEELELRELRGRPNALGCSDHFTTSGDHACSLCKEIVKKLFKVCELQTVCGMNCKLFEAWSSQPNLGTDCTRGDDHHYPVRRLDLGFSDSNLGPGGLPYLLDHAT
ncbi:homeobox-DDT domain protein RLT3 isoform X1 [Prunus yedoensis var. nudiflora]|uniref:Homeobox-DDT domain protein RLT3 isoform X1 n=1 Tax=Prunus yedoensis var. nudiflora TaxID=2094558 RepID=A0A314XU31_PRUYE|nr:homeobox-DDT domain protein RLT3 isoform X1 [Prunus yedoensis var. nudiflora]